VIAKTPATQEIIVMYETFVTKLGERIPEDPWKAEKTSFTVTAGDHFTSSDPLNCPIVEFNFTGINDINGKAIAESYW
jgi:hypothetical protein